MSKKHPAIEPIKTCLIVLLSVSALFLAARTQLFDAFFPPDGLLGGIFSGGEGKDGNYTGLYQEAARPINIVLSAEGGHFAGDASALYENCGALLGEALGSSREPMPATAADWRGALSADSIYYEYASPVRLSVLAGWFGTEISHSGRDVMVRRLCVSAGSVDPVLYYMDAETGSFYRCGTAASAASLASLTAAYLPNDSQFVFELAADYDYVDPYMLIQNYLESLPALQAESAAGPELDEALLSHFGMNAYISAPYAEQDGDRVYVEGSTTLRVSTSGLVTFRQEADGDRLPVLPRGESSEAAVIEAARQFLTDLSALVGGEGRFSLYSCAAKEGVYTLRFSCFVGSYPVFLPDYAPAAELVIQNGHITQARVYFRSYSLGQSQVSLLPARQAAAIAESQGRSEAVPGWLDTLGQTELTPQWLLREGSE